jgi:hypothetical protein
MLLPRSHDRGLSDFYCTSIDPANGLKVHGVLGKERCALAGAEGHRRARLRGNTSFVVRST